MTALTAGIKSPFDMDIGSVFEPSRAERENNKRYIHHAHKSATGWHKTFLEHLPAFNLSSAYEYYAGMRFLGYLFEAVYSSMQRNLEDRYKIMEKKVELGQKPTFVESMLHEHMEQLNFRGKSLFGSNAHSTMDTGTLSRSSTMRDKSTKTLINWLEAVSFFSFTAISFILERSQVKSFFSGAVAAEKGKDPHEMSVGDIWSSNNPIIRSYKHRFWAQYLTRFPTDLMFGIGLKAGIIGKALDITAERTVFEVGTNDIAFDKIRHLTEDVEKNNLGDRAKDHIVTDLMRITQTVYRNHRRPVLSKEQLEALTPVLDAVADGMIKKQFGMNEIIYLLGFVTCHPYELEKLQGCVQAVKEKGLEGVAIDLAAHKERFPTLIREQIKEQSQANQKAVAEGKA